MKYQACPGGSVVMPRVRSVPEQLLAWACIICNKIIIAHALRLIPWTGQRVRRCPL